MNTEEKLLERRARAFEQAKAILDNESDDKPLSSEDNETVDRCFAEIDTIDQRVQAIRKAEQVAADLAEARKELPVPDAPPAPQDDNLLRKFLTGEIRRLDFKREGRDLTKGTASAGGNTVPTSFVNRLWEHMIEVSAVRRAGPTVFTTSSGEDLQVPKTTTHSTATLTAEAAAITESDPAFGQATLGAHKYGLIVQTASELAQDTGVDLEGYLARQAGRAIGNATGTHFVTGDGSGKPRGVATASSLGKTAAGAAAITADELIDLYYSVIEVYRNNAKWMARDATIGAIRKLKDGNNQYLWQPGLVSGQPDMLLGKEIIADPNVAALATGNKTVLFGDFSAYAIRDVGSVRMERSDDFAFNTDLVTFRVLFRTDGDLIDETGAVKHLIQA